MAVSGYNPEFNPTGIEGGLDTNLMPWIPLPNAPGMSLKPLRGSRETGAFSVMMQMKKGTVQPETVYLGAMDFMVLSGSMTYPSGQFAGTVDPGVWGYIPANSRVEGLIANEDVEYLATFYGAFALMAKDKKSIAGVITALDILEAAKSRSITLVPTTLADCMTERPEPYKGPAEPLAFSKMTDATSLVGGAGAAASGTKKTNPHFVDTRTLDWIVNEATPDVGLKILRISEETGTATVIVRHNGVAPPHFHLGGSDFLVLGGRIGYRAGPPEGYGPGMWFFEPAGARHEETQRLGTEDLIYLANIYGPIQFDSGRGTPVEFVFSWMSYKEMADAAGSPLVKGAQDGSLLAWSPIGNSASKL